MNLSKQDKIQTLLKNRQAGDQGYLRSGHPTGPVKVTFEPDGSKSVFFNAPWDKELNGCELTAQEIQQVDWAH